MGLSEASWAISAALVTCLGRLGSRPDFLESPKEASGRPESLWRGGGRCARLDASRGGALRRLQKPYQTALAIRPRLNVPGAGCGSLFAAAVLELLLQVLLEALEVLLEVLPPLAIPTCKMFMASGST